MIKFWHIFVIILKFQILLAVNLNEILIIVSYDAFRNEYFDRNVTNFMNSLRFNETRANYIRNVFPTKTFPNHHTIATGVFPDVHGVLANSLYDYDLKKKLDYSFELYHFKSEIVPLWILNEMNGGRSGCMMWPGSNFDYNNHKCSWLHPFNMSIGYYERVDEMFTWIRNTTSPPNLIMFYIEEPDTHAHAFGPNSKTITDLVSTLNNVTEYIYDKIHEFKLEEKINVIHLSDHGMDELELRNVVDLTKVVDAKKVNFYGSTPVLQIVPNNLSETEDLYQKILADANKRKNYKVYMNKNLPERWKFSNDIRTGPITVVADIGYGFQDMFTSADYYEKAYNIKRTPTTKYGVHGYDNNYESMHPMFFAYGPNIKSNKVIEPFDTVDLMHLFCQLIGIDPPNYVQGKRENILGILKDENDEFQKMSRVTVLIISVIVSTILVTGLMFSLRFFKRHRAIPTYLYDEDTTVLDESKFPNYSVNSSSSYPSTSLFVVE